MATTTKARRHRRSKARPGIEVPDLQTQLEELLDSVWQAEAGWRFADRIDLALKHSRRSG